MAVTIAKISALPKRLDRAIGHYYATDELNQPSD